MTDLDIEVGTHDVEITFGELNVDVSFTVTLAQFIDSLEYIIDDPDISKMTVDHIRKRAEAAYDDDRVFVNDADLDRFIEQLKKVME